MQLTPSLLCKALTPEAVTNSTRPNLALSNAKEPQVLDLQLFAERTRFELVVAIAHYVGLANRWFQPLTHLSVFASAKLWSFFEMRKFFLHFF